MCTVSSSILKKDRLWYGCEMSKDNASGPHYGDTMRSSLLLIANPAAKGASGNRIEQAAMLFQSEGYDVNISLTGKKGDAEEYAREAARKGIPLIVAAGGDGTFNEVINGIVHTDTSMAILPMGTTNVLAKELGIPEECKVVLFAGDLTPGKGSELLIQSLESVSRVCENVRTIILTKGIYEKEEHRRKSKERRSPTRAQERRARTF